jgi:RNA polymerase sigma-70 factor, ECF subfamily
MVQAARRGDSGAFTWLYNRYARMVHGILLARVPLDQVEDLVQEVFLSVYRRPHTLRDAAAFGGWLTQIGRNRASDFHRRDSRTSSGSGAMPGAY